MTVDSDLNYTKIVRMIPTWCSIKVACRAAYKCSDFLLLHTLHYYFHYFLSPPHSRHEASVMSSKYYINFLMKWPLTCLVCVHGSHLTSL